MKGNQDSDNQSNSIEFSPSLDPLSYYKSNSYKTLNESDDSNDIITKQHTAIYNEEPPEPQKSNYVHKTNMKYRSDEWGSLVTSVNEGKKYPGPCMGTPAYSYLSQKE